MIRNEWYVILEAREVRRGKLLRVKRLGEHLVLWRDSSGMVSCLVDRCCHRGVALSAGKLNRDAVQCPFHGLEYEGDGTCRCIPANGKSAPVPDRYRVPSYPVHEAHGWIWIWWGSGLSAGGESGAVRKPDVGKEPSILQAAGEFDGVSNLPLNAAISRPAGPPSYFEDLDSSFYSTTIRDPWNAHYSRVLENQLDVVHLPFVHHNTIGRGNRTVVDGPGVEWAGDRLLFTYAFNRTDDGNPPLRPDEVTVPPSDRDFKLELIMPNLWQNHISKKLRIVAAFVPVDGSHTLLYLRTYQRFLRLPLLRGLVGFIFACTNRIIAHQDRRVVQTQVPGASSLKGGEQLIQGDLPIIEYRKKRQAWLDRKCEHP